jgi:serpin B
MMDGYTDDASLYYACHEFQMLSLWFLEPLQFIVILESPDVDSGWISKNLTYANWIHWKAKLQPRIGQVRMPRSKIETSNNMVETLQMLGIKLAFDSSNADFHNMADYSGDTSLFISDFNHKTSVEINEKGVIAGAASTVEMGSADSIPIYPPFFIELNRPFYFLIVDHETDAILFLGYISDPTPSE